MDVTLSESGAESWNDRSVGCTPRHDLLAERSVCAQSLPSSDKPLTSPEGGSAIRGRRGPIEPLSELRV